MHIPTSFEAIEKGVRVTFKNGWTVSAEEHERTKIRIQVFTPGQQIVRIFRHDFFLCNSNDLALILQRTSAVPVNFKDVSLETASESFEYLIEELLHDSVAA